MMCDFCPFKWPIKCENPSLFALLNPCNNYLLVTRRRACMQQQLSALAHAVGATVTLPDSAPSARKGSAPSAARSPAQVAATRATPAVISPRFCVRVPILVLSHARRCRLRRVLCTRPACHPLCRGKAPPGSISSSSRSSARLALVSCVMRARCPLHRLRFTRHPRRHHCVT